MSGRTTVSASLMMGGLAMLAALATAPLLAAPADQVRARIAGFRELGAAFKAINDGLRSSASPSSLRAASQKIRVAAGRQFGWFPAGSGPQAGVKTAAKPEIWRQSAQFQQLQNGFAAQAAALDQAVQSGDAARIRTSARTLGASCKACHDQFRMEAN